MQIHSLYLEWLESKGLMPKTIKEYKRYSEQINSETLDQNSVDVFIKNNKNRVARAFIKSYKDFLIMKADSNNSIGESNRLRRINIPTLKFRKPKVKQIISIEQLHAILKAMKKEKYICITALAFYCALRSNEAVKVCIGDFNFHQWIKDQTQNGQLIVRKGKGDKSRIVPVPSFIMLRLAHFIRDREVREGQVVNPTDRLFKFSYDSFHENLVKASLKVLGDYSISPHYLRHSFASYLFDKGWDSRDVQNFLGHEDISTTQIYLHSSSSRVDKKYSELKFD